MNEQVAELRLADVGEGLSEAEIVEWLVRPGDQVAADQPAVVVSTDKANVELPIPSAGIVRECIGAVGTVVPTGSVLVRIATGDGADPSGADAAECTTAAPLAKPERSAGARSSGGRLRALAPPSARRLAKELGVEIAAIAGSGPNGRVLRADVHRAARTSDGSERAGGAQAAGVTVVPLRGLRRSTAHAVSQAWRTIPHITEFRELDASALVDARERLQRSLPGLRLSFMPFVVLAVTRALRAVPTFNASLDFEAEAIHQRTSIALGIATATPDGLMVPVLRDPGGGIGTVAERLRDLAERARGGTLHQSEIANASVTITNFGSYGTWLGTPIVRLAESAIVGVGKVADRVVAVDGAPAVRPIVPLAVAADHRLNDGLDLARFIDAIASCLADPLLLLA